METLAFYLLKMILCSAVMFSYYLLFLKDKTFHHYNRFYLLLSVIISLVLPLVKVSYFTMETNKNLYLLLSRMNQNQLNTNQQYDVTIYTIFYAVAGVVSVALLIRFLAGILKINTIKKHFPNETVGDIQFYQTDLNNAPFSFFKNLFWRQSIDLNSQVGQQILKHEMVHIEQKHSWDKLLMQVAKSVFWFNPVFYFINKEINLIHEYLADKKAVKKSDTKAFAQMLLESHFSGRILPATSPFLSSNLKKRLTMLTKNKTKYSYARKLFALPILFFMVFAYMVNAKNKEIKETNKAIEIAVEQLKTDTVKPKPLESDSLAINHQNQTKAFSDALQEDHLKMAAISKKMAEKSKELSALKKAKKEDSPEYEALENDMEALATRMDDIVNSDDYKKNLKGLEENASAVAGFYNSPEWHKKYADTEKRAKEVEARVNSPQFKKRMADAAKRAEEAGKRVNSPDFKKRIADAQKIAEEAVKNVNSPDFQRKIQQAQERANQAIEKFGKTFTEEEFQKILKEQYGKDAFTEGSMVYGRVPTVEELRIMRGIPDNFTYSFSDDMFFNTAKSKLSPKELKKLEKKRKQLQEKQKDLMEEQRKLQDKQRELNKEMHQNSPWTISINATSNMSQPMILTQSEITPPQRIDRSGQVMALSKEVKTVMLPRRTLKVENGQLFNIPDSSRSADLGKALVYVNGKLIDRNDLDKIDPKVIASVSVFKTNSNGKIEIITK